jgi:hypothetical protein
MTKAHTLLVQYLLAQVFMNTHQDELMGVDLGMISDPAGMANQLLLFAYLLQREFVCGPQGLKNIRQQRDHNQTDFVCGPAGLKTIEQDGGRDPTRLLCGPCGLKTVEIDDDSAPTQLFCGPAGLKLSREERRFHYLLF